MQSADGEDGMPRRGLSVEDLRDVDGPKRVVGRSCKGRRDHAVIVRQATNLGLIDKEAGPPQELLPGNGAYGRGLVAATLPP